MEEKIKEIMEGICRFLELEQPRIETSDDGETVRINIKIDGAGLLIGVGGERLRDLECLLKAAVHKFQPEKRVFLDINNYRHGREEYIKEMAKEIARKVKLTKQPQKIEELNAYERRLIHMELASHPDLTTESQGEEPNRILVVKPYP